MQYNVFTNQKTNNSKTFQVLKMTKMCRVTHISGVGTHFFARTNFFFLLSILWKHMWAYLWCFFFAILATAVTRFVLFYSCCSMYLVSEICIAKKGETVTISVNERTWKRFADLLFINRRVHIHEFTLKIQDTLDAISLRVYELHIFFRFGRTAALDSENLLYSCLLGICLSSQEFCIIVVIKIYRKIYILKCIK